MTPEKLFEEKQYLVFAAIKQQFGSYSIAKKVAENNNMEFDDLVQVGNVYLWELCVKCDYERLATFNAYVMKGLRWRLRDEVHRKGTPFKVSQKVSVEERNQIQIQSIDLHQNGEVVHEFYAIADIDVEAEVVNQVELEGVMSVLNKKEKAIILYISEGYTTEEIAVKLGMGRSTMYRKKKEAFLKMNPSYKSIKQRSFFLGKLPYKRNRQHPLAI